MRYIFLSLTVLFLWSCGSEEETETTPEGQGENVETLVDKVLVDFSAIEKVEEGSPVEQFVAAAKEQASDTKKLKKGNATDIFEKGKAGAKMFLVVGEHTIVKIEDYEDCKASGSWGVCMPKGKGYTRKQGELIEKNDYINNIIGTPGSMSVVVYFFE